MFFNQQRIDRRESFRHAAMLLSAFAVGPRFLSAAEPTRGFDQVAPSTASLAEQKRQRGLWVLEVHLKPMRLVWVDVPTSDGQTTREQIWYLAYKAINRPLTGLVDDDTDPVNTLDPEPQKPLFIPELTLVTYDNPETQEPVQVLPDLVIPEAVTAINRIESHRPGEPVLKDTVSVIQPVPDPAEAGQDGQWIYGVATWRGVDPNTDFFKVILSGFTNGYEKKTDDGKEEMYRKVLVQKFARPGDRFDPNQAEFNFSGKAMWEFERDDAYGTPAEGKTARTTRRSRRS
jgi:hypothetical protein